MIVYSQTLKFSLKKFAVLQVSQLFSRIIMLISFILGKQFHRVISQRHGLTTNMLIINLHRTFEQGWTGYLAGQYQCFLRLQTNLSNIQPDNFSIVRLNIRQYWISGLIISISGIWPDIQPNQISSPTLLLRGTCMCMEVRDKKNCK